jgi:small-conductance mechanosensitive channel
MQMWNDFLTNFGLSSEISTKILLSLVILVVLWLVRKTTLRFVRKAYQEDTERIYAWLKGSQYAFYATVFILLTLLWIPAIGNLGTFLGIFSAGLAIAFQDPLINFAGWVFILLRRPFIVKDRIQIGELAGDVVDIGVFQITLLEIGNWVAADQSTGRVLHIPNKKVFTESVANYSQGLAVIWNEVQVMITFESAWQKAKAMLQEIAEKYSETEVQGSEQSLRDFMISYTHLDPKIYTSIADSGVVLTIRYLCKPRERRTSENMLVEEVLEAILQAEDIDFAYETRRTIMQNI